MKPDRRTPLERKALKPFIVAGFFLLIFASFWFFFTVGEISLRPLFMPPKEARTYTQSLEKAGGASGYLVNRVLEPFKVLTPEEELAAHQVKRLSDKYPFPTLYTLISGRGPYSPTAYLIVGAEIVFAFISVLLLYLIDFKLLKPFFRRIPLPENPLEMGSKYPFDPERATGVPTAVIASFFKEGGFEEFMKVADARIPGPSSDDPYGVIRTDSEKAEREEKEKGRIVFNRKKAESMVRKGVNSLLDYGMRLGLVSKEEEVVFRTSLGLSLLHHVLDYFGGVPVGFLSPRIENYTVKRVLASYGYRDKVPLVRFGDTVYEEEDVPARFLTCLHGFCREKEDLYETLEKEFCQIPGWDELVPIKRKTR